MKKRFSLNAQTRSRELLVIAQRGEILDTRRAKWLAENYSPNLLRFSYEITRGGNGAILHYDVKGLLSLKSYVRKHVLDDVMLTQLLASVLSVLDSCSGNRIPTELVMFDPSYVFVDSKTFPRFVVTPLENVPFSVSNSPLSMLQVLGNPRTLRFMSPVAEMISAKLEAFVLNQNSVFSANAFRTFLRDQCGVGVERRRHFDERVLNTVGTQNVDRTSSRMWNGVDGRSGGFEYAGNSTRYRLRRISSGEVFPLKENAQLAIGRGSKNAVQITGNPKISRVHASLYCAGRTINIVDYGSANSTWLQGRRLNPNARVTIQLGQSFFLANEEFRVEQS